MTQARLSEAYGKLPLSFEANEGQTDSQVKFLSRGSGYNLFLTSSEAVFALSKPSAQRVGKKSLTAHGAVNSVRQGTPSDSGTVTASTAAQFSYQGTKLVGKGAVGGADVGREADRGGAGTAWVNAASAPETAVSINSFTATPTNITAGQTATLTPVFDNATSATIIDASGNGMGTVISGAAYTVTPLSTATYELVVDGTGGARVTRTVTVNVNNGLAQFLQQGPKLVATDAAGNAQQGRSVSISANGNTAIVGGDTDNGGAGAAWVWTRSGGAWTQGPKLVGSGAVVSTFGSGQGTGVAISADGNTAMVGGWNDTGTWVFTRSGNVWTQQGTKLIPSGVPGFGFAGQGASVALSADGNTAIIGGPLNNAFSHGDSGAWVWTRSGSVWTQQGPILVGSGSVGDARQGSSVSISADGNTAIVGGPGDNSRVGAAWVWTRSGGVWAQQGPKLEGSVETVPGHGFTGEQGFSVALSADGNTAIVGGPSDYGPVYPSNNTGAARVWTRSGGVWTPQGPKLRGPGGASASTVQGFSVSISADGNTAIVGGVAGYSQTSSALVWTRSGGVWTHQGTKLVGSGAVGSGNGQQPGVSVSLSANGNTAIVGGWNDNSSAGAAWVFTASAPTPACPVPPINPITDPVAIQFENGNTLDTTHLSSAMQTAYNSFRNAVTNNGGQFILNSAYRPPPYQVHLREVWDKWQLLKNCTLPECQSLRTQVQTEANRHGISNLTTRPAGACGFHTQGLAIDAAVNPAQTGLPLQTMLNLASQSGLYRRIPVKDPVHFELSPPQQLNCPPQLNDIEGYAGEVENFSINSQAIQTISATNVFVTVTKQIVDNNYVYSYQVRNNDSRPILAFEIGYNDSTNASQLLIPPVDWSYDTGLAAASTTSPADWSSNLITTEENEFHSIEWRTGNTGRNIQPLQSMSGFSVVLQQDDVAYETSSFKVVFADGSTASATPSTIQLSSASYNVSEDANFATINVTRTGDTSGAATINYATSDTLPIQNNCQDVLGIASSRCDYATTIGTLRFAAGEASKTIYISIIDDNIADGNETFTLTLSNSSGASLGTTTTTTNTITDNANTAGNPIDQAAFFIREHYIDFLGREPEPQGLTDWLNIYNNCGITVAQPCDRIEISSAFFRSEEFQNRAYFVYRFYSTVGKIPLYEGFMPDFAKLSGFLSAQELEANKVAFVNEFMARQDYQSKYGSITDPTAYVEALLQTVGLPSHPGKATWIVALTNQTMTKAQVFRALAESSEVYQKYYNEAFVIMQYFGYLRRSADISYLNWIQTMNSTGGDYRTMINGFLNSAEYRQRFGN